MADAALFVGWGNAVRGRERQALSVFGEAAEFYGRLQQAGEIEGPEAALQIIGALALDDYQYLHSTRADLLRRLGRTEEARLAYERALELARNEPERRFLERRIEEL